MEQKQLDKMWAQYDVVCKRLERLQNDDRMSSYREWCELVKKESEMRRFLNSQIWGKYEPLNLPKTEDEKIASIQAMPSEKRHVLTLCDFSKHFKSASKCEKSCSKSWVFERELFELRNYKKIHGWSRSYIKTTFGVDINEAKDLYIRLKK